RFPRTLSGIERVQHEGSRPIKSRLDATHPASPRLKEYGVANAKKVLDIGFKVQFHPDFGGRVHPRTAELIAERVRAVLDMEINKKYPDAQPEFTTSLSWSYVQFAKSDTYSVVDDPYSREDLEALTVAELKDIYHEWGLDSSGKSKRALVNGILAEYPD
ncbi:hypothetical protein, partial [Antrihabitans spumae]